MDSRKRNKVIKAIRKMKNNGDVMCSHSKDCESDSCWHREPHFLEDYCNEKCPKKKGTACL